MCLGCKEEIYFRWKAEDIWVKNLLACIKMVVDIAKKFHSKIDIDLPLSFEVRVVNASKKDGVNHFVVGNQTIRLPLR